MCRISICAWKLALAGTRHGAKSEKASINFDFYRIGHFPFAVIFFHHCTRAKRQPGGTGSSVLFAFLSPLRYGHSRRFATVV
jgi:hypothetical protein